MKQVLVAAVVLLNASSALGIDICTNITRVGDDLTTNPLVFDEPYDVYHITATNRNAVDVTSLELDLSAADFGGAFVQATSAGEIVKAGAELGDVLGFENPDTFFVVPDVGADILIAPGTGVATADRLAGAYTLAGDTALIPSGGSAVIATITVPGGVPLITSLPAPLGLAAVAGQFVHVGCVPEPSSAALTLIAIAGLATRRG